jgi:DNA repair photolyase
MITPFIGEFLINSAPLEYSGNSCSHSCIYCFANNRRSCRQENFKSTINNLKKYPQRKTYTAELLKEGYPIVISNRSDPFSKNNIEQTKSLFQYFKNMPNGLFIQTKGGKDIFEALEIIKEKKNIVFYISITTLNDELSKKIESGVPVTSERIKLAKELKKRGYEIIIAINPCVEQWINEKEIIKLASDFKKCGIIHFIFQPLHLRKDYENALKQISKLPNGDIIITNALNYHKAPRISQLYTQRIVLRLINELKVNALWFGLPYPSDFFMDINKKLGRNYPSMYDFFNYCVKNKLDKIYFKDFYSALSKGNEKFFEKEFNGLSSYILRINRGVWKGNTKVQSIKTIKEVLNIFWNEKRLTPSPQNNYIMFSKIIKDGNPVIDKAGDIILQLNKKFPLPDKNGSFVNCK